MEGIMAKKKNSKYHVGQRSDDWLKIKYRNTIYCTIIGYTPGSGDRSPYFGAIHVAEQKEGKWIYYGKVGTGFNQESLRDIFEKLRTLPESPKLIDDKIEEADQTIWVTPVWRCEVQYASWSSNQTLREPVFKHLIGEDL
jgi:bifunctional non-homologous end joining protein LigD